MKYCDKVDATTISVGERSQIAVFYVYDKKNEETIKLKPIWGQK